MSTILFMFMGPAEPSRSYIIFPEQWQLAKLYTINNKLFAPIIGADYDLFMFPILARYGELFVYSFTVMMAVGVLAALGLTIWRERSEQALFWLDSILVVTLGAIIGGRAGFIILSWQYFQEHLDEVWQFSQGGFSVIFSLLGSLTALLIFSRIKGLSFFKTFATLAPAFVLFTGFAWAACWLEGCAFGRTTFIGPFSAELPDDFGIFAVRYQTQIIGVVLSALFFFLILAIARKVRPRTLFWITLGSITLIHMIPTLLRGDPVPEWAGLRVDVWASLLIITLSIIMSIWQIIKGQIGNKTS